MSPRRVRVLFWGAMVLAGVLGAPARSDEAGLTRCLLEAAQANRLDPLLIWAVKGVESGARLGPGIEGRNANGSVDLGLMQINDRTWMERLERGGFTREQVRDDACVNLHVGAAILAYEIRRHAVDGIGRYHSPNPERAHRYRARVIARWRALREVLEASR